MPVIVVACDAARWTKPLSPPRAVRLFLQGLQAGSRRGMMTTMSCLPCTEPQQ